MKQEEINDKGRRDFLKTAAVATIAATACGSLAISCSSKKVAVTEKVKLLSPDGEIVEIDSAYLNHHENMVVLSQHEQRVGIAGKKFVMVVDLSRCKNARKCISACQKWHYRPEDTEWLTVKLLKDSDKAAPYWFPKQCFHCDNPPCVKVCPVNATFKRQDGLVLIDNERCIGCKFCMAACPYSTRVFNWSEPEVPAHIKDLPYSAETGVPAKVGTVEKCDFCPDRAREGLLPPCVEACPNGVFYFGDESEDTVSNGDETLSFTQLIKDRAGYRFMEELGTKPRVYYLPPKDRQFPVERGYENLPDKLKERFKDVMEESQLLEKK
ncbi:MAG TPA: 4Fe-4S dicluster domain-containing protein [Chitinophagaceae bacterium]|nr:4Fe-4S dicluster domain-containing protein [Chitinophagaceae bacterium]